METKIKPATPLLVHTANAYPKLVEALRNAMHQVAKPEDCRAIQDLLVEIGEIR